MVKRLFAALVCLIFGLSLTACVSNAPAPATVPTEPGGSFLSTQTASAPTEIAETVPTTAPRYDDLHSGLREDGTFDAGTLFIGDSLTYGLVNQYLARYEFLGDAKYMAVVGAPVARFFSRQQLTADQSSLFSPEFSGLTYSEAAAQMGENATAIYFMLGTNYQLDATADKYIEIVDYLLENCPNATIHLQLVPYSSKAIVDYETVNGYIKEAYQHYQDAGQRRVLLIDTYNMIWHSQVFDGVHLNDEGLDAWYMAILANANNLGLPE